MKKEYSKPVVLLVTEVRLDTMLNDISLQYDTNSNVDLSDKSKKRGIVDFAEDWEPYSDSLSQ